MHPFPRNPSSWTPLRHRLSPLVWADSRQHFRRFNSSETNFDCYWYVYHLALAAQQCYRYYDITCSRSLSWIFNFGKSWDSYWHYWIGGRVAIIYSSLSSPLIIFFPTDNGLRQCHRGLLIFDIGTWQRPEWIFRNASVIPKAITDASLSLRLPMQGDLFLPPLIGDLIDNSGLHEGFRR